MAIKPLLNPYTASGKYNEKSAMKLAAMESVVSLNRDFTMKDVEEIFHDEIRWSWDNSLLEIIDDKPLTYRITSFGYSLVKRGQAVREEMEAKIAA